jgi:molecular chaperone GrpE
MKKTDEKHDEIKEQKITQEWEAKLEQKNQEVEEWKAKCMRALADYQNLERRNREEREEIRKFAGEVILGRLFSAIDTLQKAKDHIKHPGLDLAFKEFIAILQEQGVEKIQTVGEGFNPHEMECVEVVEGEDNKVVTEVLPGYRLYGKVLRVAHVTVGKKQSN